MKKNVLFMVAALLLCGAVSAQTNYWGDDPDSHAKSSNTPIVAKVQLDGADIDATGVMRLGAFVGTELRGIAAPHTDGNFWLQAFYNANETTLDEFTFKFYDGEQEYTNCNTSLTGQDEGYGTPNAPQVLDFTSTQTMTQTTELATGWTWWSTPVEQNGINGLQILENCINDYGLVIKYKGNQVMKRNGRWMGNLSSIQNELTYKIDVSDASVITMPGVVANPSDHPITITNGWNWIGYPVNATQAIGTALTNLQPEAGDVIKGQGVTSSYRNGRWMPSVNLTPGRGYMYYSNANDPKTFVYSTSRSEMMQEIQEDLILTANNHKYENNLVLIAVVYIGQDEKRDENFELGAFVNGECTGSTKLFYVEEDDRYYATMTIGGNDGDKITFGAMDEVKGLMYNESDNSIVFSNNAIIGSFDCPYKVCFNTLGIGESTMSVAMYPNPVDRGQSFKLNIPLDEDVLDVTIINALGSVVRHETGAMKPTFTGLSVAGVYTVKVMCRSGNAYYGRLIVK
ncbi:MAG: T9SS type A sorting domain-containing protein [Bacteroidales bacterium]|nr:T9SS type A sorting domain-containing protein [Bacteroidales bacterium]